jgi:hypothetical protein
MSDLLKHHEESESTRCCFGLDPDTWLGAEPVVNPQARDLTKRSLKKLVNQLKEEIARFESRAASPSDGS